VGVDDDTAIVAAFIAQRLKLTGNPTHAAEARATSTSSASGSPMQTFRSHGSRCTC